MERDRSSKIIAIIALFVAVVGLSLGFAAFTQNLTISPAADVAADDSNFIVDFSTSQDSIVTGTVEPTLSPEEEGAPTAENATISSTTITGISAHFTKDNQSVTYDFYVRNNGKIPAYLNAIDFGDGASCEAKTADGADTGLIETACDNVVLTVSVHDQNFTKDTGGIDSLSGLKLDKETGTTISVKIEAKPGATAVADDYNVTYDAITLTYDAKD